MNDHRPNQTKIKKPPQSIAVAFFVAATALFVVVFIFS
ncbi:hypothetical protein LC2W_1642 [Lacticaseibacillus paracasei]|nr:hypothetical protein LC2W_1642 [Lacticaseibacillus paracasei]KTE97676.1 hypothetical protein AC564_2450c [Lacticaseibacillus paracasei]